MQMINIVASLTDSRFSSLPGSYRSLHLTHVNTIDNEGVETNEAGIYLLLVCSVYAEYGFIFINIMCTHTHAQTIWDESTGETRHFDLFHRRKCRNISKMKTWSLKP